MYFSSMVLYGVAKCVVYSNAAKQLHVSNVNADCIDPLAVPSIAAGDWSDRTLAEIDQDGFGFAVLDMDKEFFNRRDVFVRRKRNKIQVCLKDNRLVLRKVFEKRRGMRFDDSLPEILGFRFYLEAAAAMRLSGLRCVPALVSINRRAR